METSSIKQKIINLRKKGKSYNEISKELNCSKATISYHCKREMINDIGLEQSKRLNNDEIELLKEYYKTHTIEETSKKFEVSISTVKKYSNNKFTNRTEEDRKKSNYNHVKSFRKRTKEKAVEYKGGKCNICNYDRCVSALEFHHLEPSKKDFTLSQSMNIAWNKIEEELDKCILVCANCHREIHEGIIKIVS
jgi:DNA-binding CsgD family transcriptional regulator